jgi:hypothetical protein
MKRRRRQRFIGRDLRKNKKEKRTIHLFSNHVNKTNKRTQKEGSQ